MGERFNLKSIWKSNAPEKLIVFHASSLEDEIRFYFNDEQYVVARDNKDGTFSIKCEEIQELENDKQDNESTLTYTKKNILCTSGTRHYKHMLIIVILKNIIG